MLKDLLAEREPDAPEASGSKPKRRASTKSTRPRSSTIRELSAEAGDDEKEEADVTVAAVGEAGDSSEDEDPEAGESMSARRAGKRRASKRRAKASYELAGASLRFRPSTR